MGDYKVSLTHLGPLRVRRGASVVEGDVVAEPGPSGEAEHDLPYVHLGIRVGASESYVDPLELLPPRSAASPPPAPEAPPAPLPQPDAGRRRWLRALRLRRLRPLRLHLPPSPLPNRQPLDCRGRARPGRRSRAVVEVGLLIRPPSDAASTEATAHSDADARSAQVTNHRSSASVSPHRSITRGAVARSVMPTVAAKAMPRSRAERRGLRRRRSTRTLEPSMRQTCAGARRRSIFERRGRARRRAGAGVPSRLLLVALLAVALLGGASGVAPRVARKATPYHWRP